MYLGSWSKFAGFISYILGIGSIWSGNLGINSSFSSLFSISFSSIFSVFYSLVTNTTLFSNFSSFLTSSIYSYLFSYLFSVTSKADYSSERSIALDASLSNESNKICISSSFNYWSSISTKFANSLS